MTKLPTQTSSNSHPKMAAKPSSMDSVSKIGLEKMSTSQKASYMRKYLDKRELLKVPQDIIDANPDKHFVYINMNKLEKSGFYHPEGYKLYKTREDTGNLGKDRFDYRDDGLVHRNEMVLAYLTKEEQEEREIQRAIFRENRKNSNVLLDNDTLKNFGVSASETSERL